MLKNIVLCYYERFVQIYGPSTSVFVRTTDGADIQERFFKKSKKVQISLKVGGIFRSPSL